MGRPIEWFKGVLVINADLLTLLLKRGLERLIEKRNMCQDIFDVFYRNYSQQEFNLFSLVNYPMSLVTIFLLGL